MTVDAERAALVALLRGAKQPWSVYTELVEEAGSALAVIEREHGSQTALFPSVDLDAARADIAGWERAGMQLLTILDEGYPENLRAVHDRPPLIFVAGRLTTADARSISVVGARRASAHGLSAARQIASHLATRGFTVASGLAAGIDTAAHTAALQSRGRTIAVVGTGLRRCYPSENLPLQRRIAAEGAVISQFWPDAPPTKRSFPMRNAVMSGLTLATVVVEAAHTSGARLQARLALSQGRPVFLSAALLEQEWARAYAERPGTHVFRSPEEITSAVERLISRDALTT